MPELMANYREYLRLTHQRLDATGFSPHMARIYSLMLEIAEQAADEPEYQRLHAARKIDLETYRAQALDTYTARLRQAQDDDLPEKPFYEELLQKIRAADDQETISREINSAVNFIAEDQKKRQNREYHMRAILDQLIQLAFYSPLLDVQKFFADVRHSMNKVREAEGDPERHFRDSKWRAEYRLPEKLWLILEAVFADCQAGRMPNQEAAQAEFRAEYDQTLKELSPLKGKMREHYEAHDGAKEQKRSTWVAYATPEGYEFECVWMKGSR